MLIKYIYAERHKEYSSLYMHKFYINCISKQIHINKTDNTPCKLHNSSPLTVTLVTCIYPPFQSFRFSEFGQHFSQHALRLIYRHNPFVDGVIAFRKFQGKIPERFHGIGFIVTCFTGDLARKDLSIKTHILMRQLRGRWARLRN